MAADYQRMNEKRSRAMHRDVIKSHQRRLKTIWQGAQKERSPPLSKHVMPGPGTYNGKNYIQDEPSFAVHKFQQTARPLNTVNMKDQTELIEYMQERRNIDKHASINEYRGCKKLFWIT